MKKMKRILALAAAIALASLYVITFLLAVFGSERTQGWLMASVVLTVLIPSLAYAMLLVYKVFSGKNQDQAFRRAERDQSAADKQASKDRSASKKA